MHRLAGRDIDVHFEILLYFLQLSDQTTGSKSIYSLTSPSICRIWNLYTSRVVPPAPSLSLLPVAEYNLSVDCDILSRPRFGRCCRVSQSRWLGNGHPAVVAAISAQLPCAGMTKSLRFDRARVVFLLVASGKALCAQRAHRCHHQTQEA